MPSAVHRILREGGDEQDFNQRLAKIKAEDLPRLQIIEEICSRLEFGELLKYSSQFTHHTDIGGSLSLDYNTDRLVTYLGLTSLDILAREQFTGHDFHDFPAWFISKLKLPDPPNAITSMVEALRSARGHSALNVLLQRFPAIREAYYEEEGVSRLFKRLLRDVVDSWMQEWLCSIFFLGKDVPFRDTVRPSSLPWAHLPTTERFSLIADYLFFLRNLYTHTSRHIDTQELGQFRDPNRQPLSFSIRYSEVPDAITDKVRWFVALRSDLAESEVVRMISVHLMRKWLGYSDDAAFVETYLSRLTFRYHTYALTHELLVNSNTVSRWALIESQATLLNRFDLQSLLLATNSAKALLALGGMPCRYRPFIQEQIPRYLDLLSRLNNRVQEAFDEAKSFHGDIHRADRFIRTKLKQVAFSQEARGLLRTIGDLRQSINQTLSIPLY